jgi:hypothetical protein
MKSRPFDYTDVIAIQSHFSGHPVTGQVEVTKAILKDISILHLAQTFAGIPTVLEFELTTAHHPHNQSLRRSATPLTVATGIKFFTLPFAPFASVHEGTLRKTFRPTPPNSNRSTPRLQNVKICEVNTIWSSGVKIFGRLNNTFPQAFHWIVCSRSVELSQRKGVFKHARSIPPGRSNNSRALLSSSKT